MSEATGHGRVGGRVVDVGHTHADVTGGWLRPAVFGVMDGLVSNFALIAGVAGGVAGAGGDHGTVVLAGLAGLAAGAFSMAAGEYTSVASQAELAQAELAVEREELARSPEIEAEELAQRYVARGVEIGVAREVSRQLSQHPEQALAVHARTNSASIPATCHRRCWRRSRRSWPSPSARSFRCCPTCSARPACCQR